MSRRVSGFGPSVAALILTVTIYSFACAFALDGIPDDEFGVFYMTAKVVGIDRPDITVASTGWLWVARLAGIGILASAVAIFVARKRLGGRRPSGLG